LYKAVLKEIVDFGHSVDWSGRRRILLREYGPGETPQALAPRRLPGTHAESEAAWSGNQQTSLTQLCIKMIFRDFVEKVMKSVAHFVLW
jgi:hypothetical protein